MDDLIRRLRVEGPRLWSQLSLLQRLTLLSVAVGAIGVMIWLSQWAQQPEYATAFTRLSDGDASAVVARLKELKIPYQLSDGGSTVKVPAAQVNDVRLQMASYGLPKGGGTGFELFDKVNFGLTDFAQRLNYQRALEGELSRTIGRISGVEEARVHLALPENELFSSREKQPTASVVLKLRPGSEPDGRQIRGIASLVARSVEGMKPENVTVLDGDGTVLTSGDDALVGDGRAGTQQEAQRNFEKSLQRDLQAMLEQILGPQKAVVRVSAAFDWDQHESTSETYAPPGTGAQVRSSRDVVERSALPLDDPASSTIPTYPADQRIPAGQPIRTPEPLATPAPQETPQPTQVTTAAAASSEPKYERREQTTNYEISKVIERTVKSPGALKRLNVSVVLDGPADEALTSTISKAVTAAAGLDASRGDSVVVASVPFDRSTLLADQASRAEAQQQSTYFEIARNAIAVVLLLVVLLIVRSVVRGLTKPSRLPARTSAEMPRISVVTQKMAPSEQGERPLLAQSEVAELARVQPKLVAGILKTWLDEKQ